MAGGLLEEEEKLPDDMPRSDWWMAVRWRRSWCLSQQQAAGPYSGIGLRGELGE